MNENEKIIIARMIRLYCRGNHASRQVDGTLCPDCGQLLDYAVERLEKCPHGNNKGSCRRCKIHCYSPSRRAEIRAVMRYAGPRMLLHSPFLALKHLL